MREWRDMLIQLARIYRESGACTGLTKITVALAATMSLAACALPPAPPPRSPTSAMPAAPAAPDSSDLPGTSWVLASMGDEPLVENTTTTLNFDAEGRAGGTDGCNTYGGSYVVDGSSLTFGPIISTLIACEEPIMAQAAAFQQVLAQTRRHAIADDILSLSDEEGGVLATLTRLSTDLAGTSWIVTGYNNGQQAVVSVINGTTLTLEFGSDNMVSGNSGCNTFFGPYTQESGSIDIGPLAGTLRLCPEPAGVMEQEAQYVAALESAATYRLDGDTLELRTAEDALAATLQRAP
jgi:heat shock protein HslJ